ncbi:probable acetylxylan esterase (subclass of the carboxylic acid esterases) [Cephalotrichum gorgonifer]|uniref:Carboxylic ester hydrolase n=1 Tax=Cephalotrichum gorgonifer TaxID=2041049 RepID=A0AAE8SUQ9_9PEZI|nr:probable acetylxylan esterase (subclass of the carboxylic acid esterases) [Cephalotrichum gorgonifer]
MKLLSLLAPLLPLLPFSQAQGGLTQVTSFGSNPSNAKMFLYVPANVAESPAVVVAIHYCTGTAQAYFGGSPYRQLADSKGFIVIYPESPYSGTCWDVSSRATLTHEGGANSNSIANMVRYVIDKYSADPAKVFVTGTSSGAMMTNVLAATYPDMFAAGIVYSGVPAGCFFTNSVNGWNNTCAQGQVTSTPERWAQWVTDAYPDYDGPRPRMQIYHGSADTTLGANNYAETIKQWCGVFGCDPNAPEETAQNTPQASYTKKTYAGGQLVGIYAQGVGHSVPMRGADDMAFFGL